MHHFKPQSSVNSVHNLIAAVAQPSAPTAGEAPDLVQELAVVKERLRQSQINSQRLAIGRAELEAQVSAFETAGLSANVRYEMGSLQRSVEQLQTKLRFQEAEV